MGHSSHAAHAPCPARLDHSPGTATLHTAVPSEDGAPHIQPQDQSVWKQLCPHCLRDTAIHTTSHCPKYRALPEKPCEGPKRCYSKAGKVGQCFWARIRDPSPATETCDTSGEWDSP